MAARYKMDPREFRDMSPADFMFVRKVYACGLDRRNLQVKSVKSAMAVVVVGE